MRQRESQEIQEPIMNMIAKAGGYVYKNNQNAFTERGRPDLTACIPTCVSQLREFLKDFDDDTPIGIYVGIECKLDKTKYDSTLAQKVVGQKIRNAHGIWLSVDDLLVLELFLEKVTGGKYDKCRRGT